MAALRLPTMADTHWHRALAFAVTGEVVEGLGTQDVPDVTELADRLRTVYGDRLARDVAERQAAEQAWPYPVPAELMVGIGFAQFAAALRGLQSALGLSAFPAVPPARPRPLTPDEVRLLREVPPHH